MARFLIVEARFYDHLNDMLVDGARGSGDLLFAHHAQAITFECDQ